MNYIQGEKFLEYLDNYQLFKNYDFLQSRLINLLKPLLIAR